MTPPTPEEETVAVQIAPESTPKPRETELAAPNAPDDTNVWPDEASEAAFIAESRGRAEPASPAAPAAAEADESPADAKSLPSADEMVKRIPVETAQLLEELFRARFTAVKRLRKADLR